MSTLFPLHNPFLGMKDAHKKKLLTDSRPFFFSVKLRLLTLGSAVEVTGTLRKSPRQRQPFELEADRIHVVGDCDPVVRKKQVS